MYSSCSFYTPQFLHVHCTSRQLCCGYIYSVLVHSFKMQTGIKALSFKDWSFFIYPVRICHTHIHSIPFLFLFVSSTWPQAEYFTSITVHTKHFLNLSCLLTRNLTVRKGPSAKNVKFFQQNLTDLREILICESSNGTESLCKTISDIYYVQFLPEFHESENGLQYGK